MPVQPNLQIKFVVIAAHGSYYFASFVRRVQAVVDELVGTHTSSVDLDDFQSARDLVKCCLCPIYHGGLKPTTDGHWVHLCCAWWSGLAIVKDLEDMSPVDLHLVTELLGSGWQIYDPETERNEMKEAEGMRALRNRRRQAGQKKSGGWTPSQQNIDLLTQSEHLLNQQDRNDDISSSTEIADQMRELDIGKSAENDTLGLDTLLGAADVLAKQQPLKVGRRRCTYCGTSMGVLVNCCGGGTSSTCDFTFHPLCAWFEGLYVDTKVLDPTYCRFLDDRGRNDIPYPSSGLSFSFFCLNHTPAEYAGAVRREQALLRSKYRAKVEDWDSIPGRGNRKKKKKKGGSSRSSSSAITAGNGSEAEPRMAATAQAKDLHVDAYDIDQCCVCMKYSATDLCEDTTDSWGLVSDSEADRCRSVFKSATEFLECHECKMKVHRGCYLTERAAICTIDAESPRVTVSSNDLQEKATMRSPDEIDLEMRDLQAASSIDARKTPATDTESLANDGSSAARSRATTPKSGDTVWLCSPCTAAVSSPKCCLCPRKGGAFLPTDDARWAHVFCARYSPGLTRVSSEGVVQVRMIPKELRKQNCTMCNRKYGTCIRCVEDGCSNYFHPLCAVRVGRCYLVSRHGVTRAYCPNHTPGTVRRLPSGVWVDVVETGRLRGVLERSRLIADSVHRREKLKSSIIKLQWDLFYHRFLALIDLGKRMSNAADVDGEDAADMLSRDLEHEDNTNGIEGNHVADRPEQPKKRGRKPAVALAGNIEGESLSESGRPQKLKNKRITVEHKEVDPEKLTVSFSGQEVSGTSERVYLEFRDYRKKMKDDILRTVAETRKDVGVFESQKEAREFEKDLPVHVDNYLNMSLSVAQKSCEEALSGLSITSVSAIKDERVVISAKPATPHRRGRPPNSSNSSKIISASTAVLDITGVDNPNAAAEQSHHSHPGSQPTSSELPPKRLSIKLKKEILNNSNNEQSILDLSDSENRSKAIDSTAGAKHSVPVDIERSFMECVVAEFAGHKKGFGALMKALPLRQIPRRAAWDVLRSDDVARRMWLDGLIQDKISALEEGEETDAVNTERRSGHYDTPSGSVVHSGDELSSRNDRRAGNDKSNSGSLKTPKKYYYDFEDIPYTDYVKSRDVKEQISLGDIRVRQQEHKYFSLASFEKDVFAMLNNVRMMSEPQSRVRSDSARSYNFSIFFIIFRNRCGEMPQTLPTSFLLTNIL